MADIDVTISLDDAIDVTIDPNSVPPLITQAEAEAGTSTGERVVTAQRLAQAIAALQTAHPATVSQAEAEAGTVNTLRSWTPERVKQAIAALESATPPATSPGGSDTQLQYNDGSAFGGAPAVTYTKGTKKLCLGTAGNLLIEEHRGQIYQIMQACGNQTGTYAVNVGAYNDSIVTATGNLVLQITGVVAGMSGVIILKISGAGGYTISLDPTSFTTKLNGSDDIDTVTGKKNFISWYYDGTFLYYTNTKEA